ncbi:unnamed protein product [Effrenium voratum]|nr:unnamed protein product [Effrenium voratum]
MSSTPARRLADPWCELGRAFYAERPARTRCVYPAGICWFASDAPDATILKTGCTLIRGARFASRRCSTFSVISRCQALLQSQTLQAERRSLMRT